MGDTPDDTRSNADRRAAAPADDPRQQGMVYGLRDAIVRQALAALERGADPSGVLYAITDAGAHLLALTTLPGSRADMVATLVETFPEQVEHAVMDIMTPADAPAAGHA